MIASEDKAIRKFFLLILRSMLDIWLTGKTQNFTNRCDSLTQNC